MQGLLKSLNALDQALLKSSIKETNSLHACASFKIEDFNKDSHLLSDHACAKRMIKGI